MLSLDVHAHIEPDIDGVELERLEACVVAVTRTLDEFAGVAARQDDTVAWGLGVHPGIPSAHEDFDLDRFHELLPLAPVIGEIGLDGRSRVDPSVQRRTLDAILTALEKTPRLTSVHSSAASKPVLEAIGAHATSGLVLHWWRGTESETRLALELDCHFSINAAGLANPGLLDLLPRDRILTETDHPYGDRGAGSMKRPGAVHDVEAALAHQWGVDVGTVRRQVWSNLKRIVLQTATAETLPPAFQRSLLAS